MNVYLLELVGKWTSLAIVGLMSAFGYVEITEKETNIYNDNVFKSLNVEYEIDHYETILVRRGNLPRGTENVLIPGQPGVFVYKNGEKSILQERIDKKKEIGTAPAGFYRGNLTGYGPDCRTCDGRGFVALRDKNGRYHNLIEDGQYYQDEEFGQVRIVATTSKQLANGRMFSRGTIVEIRFDEKEILAIVLDRGAAMNNAYEEGIILFDLAFTSEKKQIDEIREITRRGNSVTFEVKRWGF